MGLGDVDFDFGGRDAPSGGGGGPRDPAELRRFVDHSIRGFRSTAETSVLSIPWGPNVDVTFAPSSALGMTGATLTLYAVTRANRVKLATKVLADAATAVGLSGGAGCDSYEVTLKLPVDPGNHTNEAWIGAWAYSGRQSGGAQPPGAAASALRMLAAVTTTNALVTAKRVVGRTYFDPAAFPNASAMTWRAMLATSDVAQQASLDLYRYNASGGGSPAVVASVSSSSLAPVILTADVSSLLAAGTPLILETRAWMPVNTAFAEVSASGLEFS